MDTIFQQQSKYFYATININISEICVYVAGSNDFLQAINSQFYFSEKVRPVHLKTMMI